MPFKHLLYCLEVGAACTPFLRRDRVVLLSRDAPIEKVSIQGRKTAVTTTKPTAERRVTAGFNCYPVSHVCLSWQQRCCSGSHSLHFDVMRTSTALLQQPVSSA